MTYKDIIVTTLIITIPFELYYASLFCVDYLMGDFKEKNESIVLTDVPILVDLRNKFYFDQTGTFTLTNTKKSLTYVALFECDQLEKFIEIQNLHQTFNHTWNNKASWLPLDEYLYIVNSANTTLSYNMTMEVIATTNSNILGQVIMFEDEKQYHIYQQTQVAGNNSQIINITRPTQLVEFNFTKEQSYYFIIVQTQPGISITRLWGVRNGMRALYSMATIPAVTTYLKSTTCYSEYKKGECILMKTSVPTTRTYTTTPYCMLVKIGSAIVTTIMFVVTLFLLYLMAKCVCVLRKSGQSPSPLLEEEDNERRPLLNTAINTQVSPTTTSSSTNTYISNIVETIEEDLQVELENETEQGNTIGHIITVLVPIADFNCHKFAQSLNILEIELGRLMTNHGTDNKELMTRILLSWGEADKRVSWGKVVQALNECEQPQLADMIKKCYIDNDTEMSSIAESIVINAQVSNALDDSPTPALFLERVVTPIQTKWFEFGILLSIKQEELDSIRLNTDTPVIRFMRVFKYWKASKCAPFTWNKVIEVLRSDTIHENTLADDLTHTLQTQMVL